jgi:hypothetical protein
MLAKTPTERARHHEGWRITMKKGQVMPTFMESIVEQLSKENVEFVIVGMMSAVLQGSSVVTRDLDLCYRRTPANIARLVAALRPHSPRPRGFPADLPFVFDDRTVQLGSNFTLELGVEALDLLGEMSGVGGYEQIIANAVEVEYAAVKVKVLSLDDLIKTKTAAGRPKDLAVLPELQALVAEKKQHDGDAQP